MNYTQYNKSGLNFIEINGSDNFKVTLCDLGASLYRIQFDNKDMIMSCENILDFFKDTVYYGKTIGRVCGRFKDHKLILNNKIYELQNNENGNTLHSGFDGLHTKIFNYVIEDEEDDCITVEFDYLSKDGEAGFPGKAVISVEYRIYEDSIELMYSVFTDIATPISLTNHAYFNLGEPNLNNLKLQINSDQYVDVKEKMIVSDLLKHNNATNFQLLKNITKDINSPLLDKFHGYDMYFKCIDDEGLDLTFESSKYVMHIESSFQGCQIYSDNFESVPSITSKEPIRRSVAIEPSDNPLSNHLNEDNEFVRFIRYSFVKKENNNG